MICRMGLGTKPAGKDCRDVRVEDESIIGEGLGFFSYGGVFLVRYDTCNGEFWLGAWSLG